MMYQHIEASSANLAKFLYSLTELSHQTKVAIKDGVQLYVMERDDGQRQYCASEGSEMSFV